MTVGQLRKYLADPTNAISDAAIVVVPGSDHSYRRVGLSDEYAKLDGSDLYETWEKDTFTDGAKRVDVLVLR